MGEDVFNTERVSKVISQFYTSIWQDIRSFYNFIRHKRWKKLAIFSWENIIGFKGIKIILICGQLMQKLNYNNFNMCVVFIYLGLSIHSGTGIFMTNIWKAKNIQTCLEKVVFLLLNQLLSWVMSCWKKSQIRL